MIPQNFPLDRFCGEVVRLLDAIEYEDDNLDVSERVEGLRHVYSKTKAYFDGDLPQATLKGINRVRLATVTRTISHFVVYCWSKVPRPAQVDISIYLSIINVLDDEVNADPQRHMSSFWQDLLQGKRQTHPFWILMKAHLPRLLDHYGSFCAFNIMRCTFDYFEGCWIEQHNFQGFRGSECYPLFMRRLNCLGGAVGGTVFPAAEFDEQELFTELACVMAQISGPVAFMNDLFSYYKEFDQDEANLVSNWCTVDGISRAQALERLTDETIRSCLQILAVFKDKNPKILATIRTFIYGYVTWHFCELRYRLREVYDRADGTREGAKFRQYYDKAMQTGWIELEEWTVPDRAFRTKDARVDRRSDKALHKDGVHAVAIEV